MAKLRCGSAGTGRAARVATTSGCPNERADGWSEAKPVPFNSAKRDFDPAFSSDGRSIYFCSDRPGSLGGDDLYRVDVTKDGFGEPEHLGAQINSAGNEWAPMLSADATLLLFSSNGRGGAGRMDLFTARRLSSGAFETALPLPGEINTPGDEFDATFLSDNATVVFSRARTFERTGSISSTPRCAMGATMPARCCQEASTPATRTATVRCSIGLAPISSPSRASEKHT